MTGPRIGSLCSGYGGLDMAVQQVYGGRTVWVSDIDKGANKILAHRYPDVPNLGDFAKTDWADVEPIEILTAGYPCQPFSHAGRRKGTSDVRHLWPAVRETVRHLRPRLTVLENVAGHRSLGFDRVLGDLAEDGMYVRWTSVRASDVGGPHRRERLFILVTPNPDREGRSSLGWIHPLGRDAHGRGRADGSGPLSQSSTLLPTPRATRGGSHTETVELLPTLMAQEPGGTAEQYRARWLKSDGRDSTFLPLSMAVQELPLPECACSMTESSQTHCPKHGVRDLIDTDTWGDYADAIARWEHLLGRTAPTPTMTNTKGNPQLAPAFVEWMMGLPAGWVTDVPGITRNEALKALGNGVVPQQAAEALRVMAAWEVAA